MTDRDPRAPRHGSPGEPGRPPHNPPPQQPYGQQPYGGEPYGQHPYGTGPRGQNPYQPGPPPPAYGGGHPPPGGNPYDRPYGAPPPAYGPAPGQPPPPGQVRPRRPLPGPEFAPPLYRPDEGVAGAGFALPDEYRVPAAELPEAKSKRFFRLNRPARIILSVIVLVVGTGVAVGMPYREQLRIYDKQKTAALSYRIVPKGKIGEIDGTRFGLGKFTKGDSTLEFQAPAHTTGVTALLLYRSANKKAELDLTYMEYVFKDGRGRTWSAVGLPDYTHKGRVKRLEMKALVPSDVAGQVQPVVRPKQTLDEFDDPTRIPRVPGLVFQH